MSSLPCRADVKPSPTSGSGLFARENIPPGELILSLARPLIAVLDLPRLSDSCSNCFIWSTTPLFSSKGDAVDKVGVKACSGCKVLKYCSTKCQSQSWKRHHKHECSRFKEFLRSNQLPNAVRATIQILTMRRHGALTDDQWDSLGRLTSHLDHIRSTESHKQLLEKIEVLSKGALEISGTQNAFNEGIAQEIFAKVLTNSFALITPTYDPLGICLDPLLASANHSCDPNAFIVMDGPEVSLRALKDIKGDQEVFISYIDSSNPFYRRQSELKSRYHFTCACSNCEKGSTLPQDEFLVSSVTKYWASKARILLKERRDLSSTIEHGGPNYVGCDELRLRYMAILQAKAFDALEKSRDLEDNQEAMTMLDDNMQMCYQSGMFSPTRQPFAALRKELYVRTLTAGQFVAALMQASKIHFHVDPVLYPQPHHPLRVVHIWTLVKLIIYLVNEIDSYPPVQNMQEKGGLDFPVIAYSLLLQVEANVEKSHGKSSRFAQMVYRKAEEVKSDLTGGNEVILKGFSECIEPQWRLFKQAGTWLFC
ncbi:SET domain-containing protein [Patellaria atrata CBS 101060]|uniref:SET domain-containing protein n=1 Tax=Patellaria atrata CBS 101060 TaxID=1346257 RepID=A0A9P4S3C6_9PEZI|nr:SET domain-containing protein [Patellaria atrata CBS 101060]